MIISVHIPKAGGTSFKLFLHENFKTIDDYGDIPLNKSEIDRQEKATEFSRAFGKIKQYKLALRNIECIHGHFLPVKYEKLIGKNHFVTWLRDPLERLASHYYFWQREFDPLNSPALHQKVILENWTLEQFCLSDELRNIYAQFFWNFPIENFDFIGIVEHFEDDLNDFADTFKTRNPSKAINVNNNASKSSPYFTDPALIAKIKEFHAVDYGIYQKALALRTERLNKLSQNS
jgi:hypothetical protein